MRHVVVQNDFIIHSLPVKDPALGEGLVAELALEGSLASVLPVVPPHHSGLGKPRAAPLPWALERLLPGVLPLVFL